MGAYIELQVKSSRREEMIEITAMLQQVIAKEQLREGLCFIFIPHTTCGVTINESADPDVVKDITGVFAQLVPRQGNYRHLEGNADAHIKASIVGASQQVIVSAGRLVLGTWQGVFLCEFDGPRQRKVWVKLL